MFNSIQYIFFDITNIKTIIKLLIVFNIINFYNTNNLIERCFYLYLFFFLILLLLYTFNTLDMLGFFVFVETTAILLYFVIMISFFDIFTLKKKKNINFLIFFVFITSEKTVSNFLDTRFFFLEPGITHLNSFLGLYIMLYLLNANLFILFVIFFLIVFLLIFKLLIIYKLMNDYYDDENGIGYIKNLKVVNINHFINTINYFK